MSAAGQYSLSDIASPAAPQSSGKGQYSLDDLAGPSKTQADYEREHPESDQIRDNMLAGAKGVAQAFNPIEIAKGAYNTVVHPIDTIHGIIALPAHLKDLYDSGQHEQLMQEIGRGLGSVALAKAAPAIPGAANRAVSAIGDFAGSPAAAAVRGAVEGGASHLPIVSPIVKGALKGASESYAAKVAEATEAEAAHAEAAAAAAREARIAAQRANPRPSLADQAGIKPEQPQPIPAVQPITPAFQAIRRPILQPTPAAPARISLSDALNIQPEVAKPVSPLELTPDIAAAAKARLAENLANRRPAAVPAPNASVAEAIAPQTAADAELLNGLAQSLTKKPFARLNSVEQTAIRDLARKGSPPPTPVVATPTEVAPNASVSQAIQPKAPPAGFDEMLRQTLERLRAKSENDVGGEIEPLHMRAEEPEDYSSLLEQSIEMQRQKTLSAAIKKFAKKKDQ